MINMKKQVWRAGALCLAGVVALSVTGVSVYAKTSEKKETELKEQIQDAVGDIWKSEDTTADSIDETVYVILDADGSQKKIYVSDWLKNQGEKDSYTQTTSDKEAPISVKITYTLDGNEISPAELNGKSGHVTIRYDYTNNVYETREIAGKNEKIYVPFAVMTGMIVDNDVFSNIQVSSGKVINDGNRSVVTGIVFPGLGTNLDMEEDLDDYLEIEADATDFTLNESYCIATNSVFSRLDLSNMDDLDDLKDAMNDLDDATMQLMDGSSELYDGVCELYDKSGDLTDGVKKLADGSADLRDGAYQLADGTVTLRDGVGAIKSGAESLQSGAKSLQSGAADLSTGLNTLNANSATLNAGAAQVFDTLINTVNSSDGVKTLISQGLMQSLTKENYSEEMTSAIQKLTYLSNNETATRALVLKANNLTEEQYQAMKNYSANTSSTAANNTSSDSDTSDVNVDNNTTGGSESSDVNTDNNTANGSESSDVNTDNNTANGSESSDVNTDNNTANGSESSDVNTDNNTANGSESSDINTDNNTSNSSESSDVNTDNNTSNGSESSAQTNPYAETIAKIDAATSQYMSTFASAVPTLTAAKASLDSYNTFYQGLLAYTTGVASANDGAAKLAAGSTQLADGAAKLVSGSDSLFTGATTLMDGSKELASGAGTLTNGVNDLSDGSDKLIDGIRQLRDGAKELKDGIVQFNDEGISKLTELDTDELQEVIDRMKATASVSENYNSFTGSNDGMDSSVKFIYKIGAVK